MTVTRGCFFTLYFTFLSHMHNFILQCIIFGIPPLTIRTSYILHISFLSLPMVPLQNPTSLLFIFPFSSFYLYFFAHWFTAPYTPSWIFTFPALWLPCLHFFYVSLFITSIYSCLLWLSVMGRWDTGGCCNLIGGIKVDLIKRGPNYWLFNGIRPSHLPGAPARGAQPWLTCTQTFTDTHINPFPSTNYMQFWRLYF